MLSKIIVLFGCLPGLNPKRSSPTPRTIKAFHENRLPGYFLRTVGCDIAQGYFIAKPMLAADLAGWLAEWEARYGKLVAAEI